MTYSIRHRIIQGKIADYFTAIANSWRFYDDDLYAYFQQTIHNNNSTKESGYTVHHRRLIEIQRLWSIFIFKRCLGELDECRYASPYCGSFLLTEITKEVSRDGKYLHK